MATDTQVMLWFVVDPPVWTNCWITGQQGWWRCGGWERVQTQPLNSRGGGETAVQNIFHTYFISTVKLWDVLFRGLDLLILAWFLNETSSYGNYTLNQACWWRGRLRSSICVGQSAQQVPEQLPSGAQPSARGQCWRATVETASKGPHQELAASYNLHLKSQRWQTGTHCDLDSVIHIRQHTSVTHTTTPIYSQFGRQFKMSEINCILVR